MTTKQINGLQFEKMLRNGLANLRSMETTVNNLNVFPVADGDTGTNLCLTLENGLAGAASYAELNTYLDALCSGLLLGARGNSGVILSQFFRGMQQELSDCAAAGPLRLRNALVGGYRAAYAAVAEPVEGTMLTVFRDGIEQIREKITAKTTIEQLMAMYVDRLKRCLILTTQQLPALKEAGVVDSGAMGFVILAEGMLLWLDGEILEQQTAEAPALQPNTDTEFFHEDSAFEKGYCMEFVLQLLRGEAYCRNFRTSRFVEDLQGFGDSIAVVQEKKRVKVHIHTKKPAKVIQIAQEYGEFVTFKLENMQIQHNEQLSRQAAAQQERVPLAIIAVASGAGMKQIFEDLGCRCVIDGGTTMNPASSEFLDAFAQVNAETIVVLPNHKNNIPAAEQAISLCGRTNIRLLPTKSMAEGYFAAAMDVADSDDIDYRLAQMQSGLQGVTTLLQTTASRDYTFHQISCRTGDELVLRGDELVCVSDDACQALVQALRQIPDIEDKESCVIFCGADPDDAEQQRLEELLQEQFPMMEPAILPGGQEIYRWIAGVI